MEVWRGVKWWSSVEGGGMCGGVEAGGMCGGVEGVWRKCGRVEEVWSGG